MKPTPTVSWPGTVAICLLLYACAATAQDKPIRLRNEVLRPAPFTSAANRTAQPAADRVFSGVFLVQFTGRVSAAERQQLKSLGVEVIRYVPEDAVLVQADEVRLGQLRAVPGVRWVGDYRPDHKLHRALTQRGGSPAGGEDVAVSLLLSPTARAADVAAARQTLARLDQAAHHDFGTIWRGNLSRSRLLALAESPAVLWIEPAPKMRLFDEVSSKIVAGEGNGHNTAVMDLGFDGTGVTVAVADSGLDSGNLADMHPDLAGRVGELFYYGNLEDAADFHSHGTHVAGIIAGNGATGETDETGALYGLGVAPGARIIAQRLFDGDGNYEAPPSFETLIRDAVRAGADVGNNSWGDDTQGGYDLSAAEFDALVRDADALTAGDQPYILEFSAGNAGPNSQTVGSPAVAKNVIATGASQNNRFNLPLEEFTIYDTGQETMADFSSRGPCADGRIKPDVVAPGTWIASLRSVNANDDYAWWPISDHYMYQGGTSQAGPQVAGAAAVLVQYLQQGPGLARPSPALVKAALIHAAVNMDDDIETGPVPNGDEGWGRVDLTEIIGADRDYEYLDQSAVLATGQIYERRVLVAGGEDRLKITLAYTDVPGMPFALVALVNDLDLEVIGPDNTTVYRGNQFNLGESAPNPPAADRLNNVEGVYLQTPVAGEYVIRVRGHNVVEDARRDTAGVVDQDFALVISGRLARPGTGIVTFDRSAYTAPAVMRLVLVDHDRAGQPSTTILLRSTTEPAGEAVVLVASGSTGRFTNTVATATGPAQANGRLEVSHGDLIEAVYQDASPPATRVYTARADLLPPVIANVAATDRFGINYVSWTTDEPATGIVRYGTNTLNLAVTNRFFETATELSLPDVVPNRTYAFLVIAEDRAGNRATNDNGGSLYRFTSAQPPTVLIVDAYHDDFFDVPPLSGYTDPLNALGVTYDTWITANRGTPPDAILQPYRCVIWRVPEFKLGTTWSAAEARAVTNYLGGGGSLLIASMEFLSRLVEDASAHGMPNFARDWLQVQSHVEDVGVPRIIGVSGEPIGSGLDVALNYALYEDEIKDLIGITADASDIITPTTNAAPILLSGSSVVGVRSPRTGLDRSGRVVFLPFALDAVPLGSGVGNNRIGLLRNLLNFLAPTAGNSTLTLDSAVYTTPSRVTVEVEAPALDGEPQTTVVFTSSRQTNGVLVTLNAAPRRGLFRGTLTLVATNGAGSGPQLLVQSGDTIQAEFTDPQSGRLLTATATIETEPPTISNVQVEPGYLDARVTWTTSEPTDALVQYSESPGTFPINFIAYDPNFDDVHELTLNNLAPDRTYYFRVVSRDRAGNQTVEDNHGALYRFRTLRPAAPPWADDLEPGDVGWTTYRADESEIEWTLGAPGNGAAAHSPVTAWGSNLDGRPASLAESFLISPAIALTGGTRATLRFWQNYDFLPQSEFDIFEYGELLLITNEYTSPITLDARVDASGDWEEVQYDLTPHLGKVVYVVWHYFLISFDTLPRFGWLVDDVAITVTNIAPGTVVVTNNLARAIYVLNGPTPCSGSGWGETLTNAAPGQYRIEYGDVPYYVKPANQTNQLASGQTITLPGHYTITDVNGNGMADSWEMDYFQEVSPQRTATTDTDDDGFPDWAEFMAGTDPRQPTSRLRLLPPVVPGDATVRFVWPAVSGRMYRLEGSADAQHWIPISDWIRATTSTLAVALPQSAVGNAYLFRLEVKP